MDQSLLKKYLPVIKKQFPDLKENEIKFFDNGYDHYVFVVTNKAFRFPRDENNGKKDEIENKFLSKFFIESNGLVQNMQNNFDENLNTNYQTYNFIPGIPLTENLAKSLSENELKSIASEIGKFLRLLHSSPLDEARSINMDELDPKIYWKYFEEILEKMKKTMFIYLTSSEKKWIENLTNNYINLTKDNPFNVKVTHSDLLGEHLIIDDNTHKLNGVIDFSLRIADPAIDFQYFERLGKKFLEKVYENYLSVDKLFDKRRKFYEGHYFIINFYESLIWNHKMKDVYLKELKNYIANQNQTLL